jgi:hypothetical protein
MVAPTIPAPIPAPIQLPQRAVEAMSVVTTPRRSEINVEVSVEPKEAFILKRVARRASSVASHLPLLGRLPGISRAADESVSPAQPYGDLRPGIPDQMHGSLAEQIAVDIGASIDDQGHVKNAEIMRATDDEVGALSADAVRTARWKPARSGEHTVPMDVVVHYRFSRYLVNPRLESTNVTAASTESGR